MRRYIVLLLITGLVWAQTDFDTLVLKDGTTYFGELVSYSTKTVIFVSGRVQYYRPISTVESLVLEDGTVLIKGYQNLSTKEKAIYDAKSKNLDKWALYVPISTIIFGGCTLLYQWYDEGEVRKVDSGEWWESPIFLGGSSAASLSIPYLALNNKEKFNFPKSILTDSEKEIYKQAYSKKLKKRKFKYIVGSTIVTGVAVSLIVRQINSGFNMSGGGGGGGKLPWHGQ